MVVPTGKKLPAGTPLRAVVTEQLSLAAAIPKTASLMNAPHDVASGPVAIVTAGGAVIFGGVSSITVTLCLPKAVLPLASVAVYVTTLVPTGKRLPAGTPSRAIVTEQLSLAVAAPSTASLMNVPHDVALGPVAVVNAGGALTVGSVWSTTVTIALDELEAP